MADNTQLNANVTSGDIVATDDIGGVKHQRVKMEYGDDGSATDVSHANPMPITHTLPFLDAFGRHRVSMPFDVFEVQHQYNTQPLIWDDTVSGTGAITHLPNESSVRLSTGGTASGAKAMRTTKQYFRYKPGKSQLVLMTGNIGALKSNVRQRIGFYNDNNGLFFEQDGTNLKTVVRTYTSGSPVDNTTNQSSWNIDTLDGAGPSGLTLDMSKTQIFVFDFQWLGAGRVRFGFIIDGNLVYCHEANHANSLAVVYMTTANLPMRYDIENTGVAASSTNLTQICDAVISEGGQETSGLPFSVGNGATIISVTTQRALLSIRRKSTFNSITNTGLVIPQSFEVYSQDVDVYYEIIHGTTLGGSPSYSSVNADSLVEYDVAGTTITGGRVIKSGYVPAGNKGSGAGAGLLSKLTLSNSDVLTIAVTSLVGATDCGASINWTEVY
jgi:hypothetical protein